MGELSPQSEFQKPKIEVKRIPWRNGAKYILYFPDEASAHQLVRDFWIRYSGGRAARNIDEGMLQPTIHTITLGPRTEPYKLSDTEMQEHHGMILAVGFNGNTQELSAKAERVLQEVLREHGLES